MWRRAQQKKTQNYREQRSPTYTRWDGATGIGAKNLKSWMLHWERERKVGRMDLGEGEKEDEETGESCNMQRYCFIYRHEGKKIREPKQVVCVNRINASYDKVRGWAQWERGLWEGRLEKGTKTPTSEAAGVRRWGSIILSHLLTNNLTNMSQCVVTTYGPAAPAHSAAIISVAECVRSNRNYTNCFDAL